MLAAQLPPATPTCHSLQPLPFLTFRTDHRHRAHLRQTHLHLKCMVAGTCLLQQNVTSWVCRGSTMDCAALNVCLLSSACQLQSCEGSIFTHCLPYTCMDHTSRHWCHMSYLRLHSITVQSFSCLQCSHTQVHTCACRLTHPKCFPKLDMLRGRTKNKSSSLNMFCFSCMLCAPFR